MKTRIVIVSTAQSSVLLAHPELFSSPMRLSACEGIKNERVRLQKFAAELALSYALSGKKLLPPEYSYAENGKPVIEGGFISLSHSAGFAACAYSDCPVGVDIEAYRRINTNISRKILSEGELAEFLAGGDEGYLLKKFVMKEAYLKMTGEGIFKSPASVEEKNGVIMRNGSSAGFLHDASDEGYYCFAVTEKMTEIEIIKPAEISSDRIIHSLFITS